MPGKKRSYEQINGDEEGNNVVEKEVKATELPITLQEKLSAWPEVSKLETEEKINKMFKLLEDVVRILMIQV